MSGDPGEAGGFQRVQETQTLDTPTNVGVCASMAMSTVSVQRYPQDNAVNELLTNKVRD
jgi:hypothetical protein